MGLWPELSCSEPPKYVCLFLPSPNVQVLIQGNSGISTKTTTGNHDAYHCYSLPLCLDTRGMLLGKYSVK